MTKNAPVHVLISKTVKSSSSNNIYTVTLYDDCISCTCPAGGRKTFCKHMTNIVFENLELIKNTNQDFYNDLILLLEMKNDKYHDIEQFKDLSHKLIYTDKGIAQLAAINAIPFAEEKNKTNDLAETIANDIDSLNIYHQFEFFDLLCLAYNNMNLGFRYCEYPQNLDEFIKMGYLIAIETTNLKEFRKMDPGRKSIYFYKLAPEIIEIRRKLHKILSVKFPKIQEYDEDGLLFTEKRIIDPKYLKE